MIFPRCPLSSPAITGLVVCALAVSGCRDNKVESYRIPKEDAAVAPVASGPAAPAAASPSASAAPASAQPAAAPSAMASGAVATATGAALTWTAPANWQVKTGSAMRKGSYTVPGADGGTADLAITAFPGDVGGEVANVNRWRGQLQLAPLPDAEIPGQVARLTIGGLAVTLVDFANPSAAQPQRMIGAMVPFEGATWFFKLMGPDALVAKEKPAFLEFLKSVKPAAPTP